MKYFTIGYMCYNANVTGQVRNGYNPIKVVKGKSAEQVREKWAGRCGFRKEDETFVVGEVI